MKKSEANLSHIDVSTIDKVHIMQRDRTHPDALLQCLQKLQGAYDGLFVPKKDKTRWSSTKSHHPKMELEKVQRGLAETENDATELSGWLMADTSPTPHC